MSLLYLTSLSGMSRLHRGFEVVPPVEPPAELLGGVGSVSTSLADYPKIAPTTVGNWYVDGSRGSSGDGTTLETAFQTIGEGLAALSSGQTLLVKGGTYSVSTRFNRTTNWGATTRIMGYGTDRPIIDFTEKSTGDGCIRFQSSSENELWHRFYVINSLMYGGSYQVFILNGKSVLSDIWVSHCRDTPFMIGEADENLIQDCVTWRLGDGVSTDTNVPDGFGCTSWSGSFPRSQDNVFVRCVAINAPDDGFDFWGGENTHAIDCVAIGAGRYWDGSNAGDGNGFKLGGGGSGLGFDSTIRGSVAVRNKVIGITHNGRPDMTFHNNTSADNGNVGYALGVNATATNNISNGNSNDSQVWAGTGVSQSNNTWNLSITNAGFYDSVAYDYSLAEGSAAIGAGTSGVNIGATEVALELAKRWGSRDTTGYANLAEWTE